MERMILRHPSPTLVGHIRNKVMVRRIGPTEAVGRGIGKRVAKILPPRQRHEGIRCEEQLPFRFAAHRAKNPYRGLTLLACFPLDRRTVEIAIISRHDQMPTGLLRRCECRYGMGWPLERIIT